MRLGGESNRNCLRWGGFRGLLRLQSSNRRDPLTFCIGSFDDCRPVCLQLPKKIHFKNKRSFEKKKANFRQTSSKSLRCLISRFIFFACCTSFESSSLLWRNWNRELQKNFLLQIFLDEGTTDRKKNRAQPTRCSHLVRRIETANLQQPDEKNLIWTSRTKLNSITLIHSIFVLGRRL